MLMIPDEQLKTIEDATRVHIMKSYVEKLINDDEESGIVVADKMAMCSILGIEQKVKKDDR